MVVDAEAPARVDSGTSPRSATLLAASADRAGLGLGRADPEADLRGDVHIHLAPRGKVQPEQEPWASTKKQLWNAYRTLDVGRRGARPAVEVRPAVVRRVDAAEVREERNLGRPAGLPGQSRGACRRTLRLRRSACRRLRARTPPRPPAPTAWVPGVAGPSSRGGVSIVWLLVVVDDDLRLIRLLMLLGDDAKRVVRRSAWDLAVVPADAHALAVDPNVGAGLRRRDVHASFVELHIELHVDLRRRRTADGDLLARFLEAVLPYDDLARADVDRDGPGEGRVDRPTRRPRRPRRRARSR